MREQSPSRRTAGLVLVGFLFACAAAATATRQGATVLTRVALTDTTPEFVRIELTARGVIDRVDSFKLEGGRFVFDLTPVIWDGPTRRVRPGVPGVREYRFSQFSHDPPVTRFVVEVDSGWSCRHDVAPAGIMVVCGGAPGPATARSTIAVVRRIKLGSPLAGLDAEDLIDRSLAYTPQDTVRDGLPNFGSVRDDWKGAPRAHKGIDIYVDQTPVQAVANGTVVGVGEGERAGGWAKIDHGMGVETVYVHVSGLKVEAGDDVVKGQRIATVDGASGNAIEAQLHFELRLDDESVDPVPFIFDSASEDLRRKITRANERLEALRLERTARVRRILEQ